VAQVIDLVVQVHDLELGPQVDQVVVLGGLPVAGGRPVLAHHDDRRLDRRERREHQVEEDEGVGIEGHPLLGRQHVPAHPEGQRQGEAGDEGPGAADRRHAVGQPLAGRAVIDDQARIDAARRLGGDQVDDAALHVVERFVRTAEELLGELLTVLVGHRRLRALHELPRGIIGGVEAEQNRGAWTEARRRRMSGTRTMVKPLCKVELSRGGRQCCKTSTQAARQG